MTYFRSALEVAGGRHSSDWYWAALAPIHENIHVDDFIRFYSCAPWLTSEGQAAMRKAGYTARDFNEAGFEKWTRVRSYDEYNDAFGVRAPEDPEHRAADDNKQASVVSLRPVKVRRWLLLPPAVAAAGTAWWYWTGDAPAPIPAPPAVAVSPPPEPSVPLKADLRTADAVVEPAAAPDDPDRLWEAVRRQCSWPPLPSSWEVLGEPCLSAIEALAEDGWRRPLADALGTRRTVAAALDNPECGVALAQDWPGEIRPSLREPCSAAAMVRLAELQDQCVEKLHMDWESVRVRSNAMVEEISDSQEEYHRLVESDHRRRAYNYSETYLCRMVRPEAFEWIEALPVPPGDPTAHRYERPPITQALDLYDAARRLGAEIPDWALEKLEYRAEVRKRELAEASGSGEGP